MTRQVPTPSKRPAPGHYQGRLMAVLTRHPVRMSVPRSSRPVVQPSPLPVGRAPRQPRRSRAGQLALPLGPL